MGSLPPGVAGRVAVAHGRQGQGGGWLGGVEKKRRQAHPRWLEELLLLMVARDREAGGSEVSRKKAAGTPSVQDMYTRLSSANLDFDSELQHVFCWELDECRDSRVFHVDRVFLRLC